MKFLKGFNLKFLLKVSLVGFVLFSTFFSASINTLATSKFVVVTGSFLESQHRLIAGSKLDSQEIFIEVKNTSTQTMKITLSSDVKDGITLIFSQLPLEVSAGSSLKIPVGISVDQSAKVGEYEPKLLLETQVGSEPKEVITLTSKLSIEAVFGQVTLQIVSPDQKPVLAQLELMRMVNGVSVGVRTVTNISNFIDKLVPGDYKAIVSNGEYKNEFLLSVGEVNQAKRLIVDTIYVVDLTVSPIVESSSKKVASVEIKYVLDNLNDEKKTLQTLLLVYDQDRLIDEVNIAELPTVSIGKSNQTFIYTPLDPLKGTYTFEVKIIDSSKIVLNTKTSTPLKLNADFFEDLINTLKPVFFFLGFISALYLLLDGFNSRRKAKGIRTRSIKPMVVKEVKKPKEALPTVLSSKRVEEVSIPKEVILPVKQMAPIIIEKPIKTEPIVLHDEPDTSYLPSNFVFTGDISSQADIVINGTVYGNITSEKAIIIEADAKIIGKLNAEHIQISGFVEGEVISKQSLMISKTGKVTGIITPTQLMIESGAELNLTINGMKENA